MSMSLATEQNSDYINKVFVQAWTLQKIETFYALSKVCVVQPRLSNIPGVSKNEIKFLI